MSPTFPGLQGTKRCAQYIASRPHKPIFYPSNSFNVLNLIRLTWSWDQVEYYTTQNCLECHQDANHAIIINIRRSVSGIINNMLGVAVYYKVQI